MPQVRTTVKGTFEIVLTDEEEAVKESPMNEEDYASDIKDMLLGDLDEENAEVKIKVTDLKEEKV